MQNFELISYLLVRDAECWERNLYKSRLTIFQYWHVLFVNTAILKYLNIKINFF